MKTERQTTDGGNSAMQVVTTRTKLIWQKAELFVSIRQVANFMFCLGV